MFSGNRDKRHFSELIPLVLASSMLGALLIFTLWDVAWTLAYNSAQANRYAQYYAANAAADIQDRCFFPDVATAECIREIVESTHEHERAEADLESQRNMAKWSLWVVIVSAATLTITAIGVWYVRQTLIASRDATKAAGDAAGAAVEANQIVKRSTQMEHRAWVSFHGVRFHIGAVDGVSVNSVGVEITFKNIGHTPAINVLALTRAQVGNSNVPLKQDPNAPFMIAAPGYEFHPMILGFSADQIANSDAEPLYIRVKIIYEDVFAPGETHVTDKTVQLLYRHNVDIRAAVASDIGVRSFEIMEVPVNSAMT